MTVTLPSKVRIVEVGPRDGLQSEKNAIPTADKVAYINALSESGLPDIEITSFVSPKAIPQLADAVEVSGKVARKEGVTYWALVPNLKGLERAIEVGITHIAVFTAASEKFNLANINKSIEDAFEVFKPVIEKAKELGMTIRGYVSTAFYCPYEEKEDGVGKVDKEKVRKVTQKLLDMGVDEVSIGDTIGKATPEEGKETVGYLLETIPKEKLAMHFHDTYGHALDNIRASVDMGITTFDSSAGGIGGCPYAPGASGNVSTEAVVSLMNDLKIETGVDAEKLSAASQQIRNVLSKVRTPSSSS